jgi:hypothetical protein
LAASNLLLTSGTDQGPKKIEGKTRYSIEIMQMKVCACKKEETKPKMIIKLEREKHERFPMLTKSIICGSSTSQLVNNYERLMRGTFQDGCCFKHFLHKG